MVGSAYRRGCGGLQTALAVQATFRMSADHGE